VFISMKKLVVLEQELERARAAVADLLAGGRTALADALDDAPRDARCRRFLDDLLVPALHRAVALEQVNGVLVLVGQHLDLDVPGIPEELLHVHLGIAERRLRLGARERHRRHERSFGVHDAHSPSAAAAGRLDDHRIANRARDLDDLLRILGQRTLGARDAGYARLEHRHLGADLVPHQPDGVGSRADEHEPGALDLFGKIRVLGQESVARMNRLASVTSAAAIIAGTLSSSPTTPPGRCTPTRRRDARISLRRPPRSGPSRCGCRARHARWIRSAISTRLAIRILPNS
jgi:hypothetical protein